MFVDDRQQYPLGLFGQGEGHAAGAAPGDGKLARGFDVDDFAIHAVLGAHAFGALAWRVGQLVVAPRPG